MNDDVNSRRPKGMQGLFIIWIGQMISGIASSITFFALPLWILNKTGTSGSALAYWESFFFTSYLVVVLFAGVFIDRYNRKTMMLGNHGVLVAAASVAEAFDELYYLERACQTLVLAYSTGKPLNIMSDKVAERTARDWDLYADSAFVHFEEMKKVLDSKDPSYAE